MSIPSSQVPGAPDPNKGIGAHGAHKAHQPQKKDEKHTPTDASLLWQTRAQLVELMNTCSDTGTKGVESSPSTSTSTIAAAPETGGTSAANWKDFTQVTQDSAMVMNNLGNGTLTNEDLEKLLHDVQHLPKGVASRILTTLKLHIEPLLEKGVLPSGGKISSDITTGFAKAFKPSPLTDAQKELQKIENEIKSGLPRTNPKKFYKDLVTLLMSGEKVKPLTDQVELFSKLQQYVGPILANHKLGAQFGANLAQAYQALGLDKGKTPSQSAQQIAHIIAQAFVPFGDMSATPALGKIGDQIKGMMGAASQYIQATAQHPLPKGFPPKGDDGSISTSLLAAAELADDGPGSALYNEIKDGTWQNDPNFAQKLTDFLKDMPTPPTAADIAMLQKLKAAMQGGNMNSMAELIVDQLQKEGYSEADIKKILTQIASNLGSAYGTDGKSISDAFTKAANAEVQLIFESKPPLTPAEIKSLLDEHTGEVVHVAMDAVYREIILSDPNLGIMYLIYKVIMSGQGLYGDTAYTMSRINDQLKEVGNISNTCQDLLKQLTALQNLKLPVTAAEQQQVNDIVNKINSDQEALKKVLSGADGGIGLEALGGSSSDLYKTIQSASGAFDNALNSPGSSFSQLAANLQKDPASVDSTINNLANQLQMTSGQSPPKYISDLNAQITAAPSSLQGTSTTLNIAVKQQETSVDTLMKFNASATTMFRGFAQFMTNYSGN